MTVQIAIDIGGTFTDVIAREDGAVYSTKVPTTPENLIQGVQRGIDEIIVETKGDRGKVERFVHGTTAGTNAVIERNGGTVGILMTKGFRDTLAIGRQKREDMYDLFLDEQTPTFLAPRERRLEIDERIGPDGEVLSELDEEDVIEGIHYLVEEHDVDSVAVCYLFSFTNSDHEERTAELIKEVFPDVDVSLSSTINPRFREYERLVVTAFDAYLRPVIESYVTRMNEMLDAEGIRCELQIMQSRGGIAGAELMQEKPVGSVLSGPAAAVAGANDVGRQIDREDMITIDIGGTSSDVSLIEDGKPQITSEGNIQDYPLRMQMVDISTIGSGGGSVAWLDDADSLRVGPESAGADPGPACYGQGGTEPTVTDGSLVLGYLNPNNFADGAFELDPDAARESIAEMVAEPLGYDLVRAAKGIHQIMNTKMAQQLRLTTVQRGFDPRNFSLFAMGGAGPIHAGKLAEELAIPEVIIPRSPGVLSAAGLLSADVEHDHELTFLRSLGNLKPGELATRYARLTERGKEAMAREGIDFDAVETTYQADMRYEGQSFEIEHEVPIAKEYNEAIINEIREQFHDRHEEVYGHKNVDDPVEFVNLRVINSFSPEQLDTPSSVGGNSLADARKTTREAHFVGDDRTYEAPVYDREQLPVGESFEGPAIVEQSDTTTVIYPGHSCRTDKALNLIIDTGATEIDR
ncbi:hydantoinase/oxoprolinase family protein [Halalkalirubrum salinum]|uniref:hydantoinase/oxoprolinase family protein n=1 Tax=Halalkalirubrum salinum TaxID=2563889 RepID=UPI0010FAEE33|nr:hydantoinase/oxoprolinase family protein [Halalkalirubrum salinum]